MTCKITAKVQRVESLRGRVTLEEQITASVPRLAGPIVDGWYAGGVRQQRQFQQILESLRVQHQPQHWASWALDGSLEEDGGRLPLVHSNLVEFVPMGARMAAQFGGVGSSAMYGTEEDFAYLHREQIFTLAGWFLSPGNASLSLIAGTTDAAARTGVRVFDSSGRPYSDIVSAPGAYVRFTPSITFNGVKPRFYVLSGTAAGIDYYMQGILGQSREPSPHAGVGPSHLPFTIGLNAPNTIIWNVFATDAVLSDEEIYRLYLAGMQELM